MCVYSHRVLDLCPLTSRPEPVVGSCNIHPKSFKRLSTFHGWVRAPPPRPHYADLPFYELSAFSVLRTFALSGKKWIPTVAVAAFASVPIFITLVSGHPDF